MTKFELEPGETVLARVTLGPSWIPVLLALVGLILASTAGSRLAIESADRMLEIALVVTGVTMIASSVSLYGTARIVTFLIATRRLLRRTGPGKYEDFSLSEIERIEHDPLVAGLVVVARGSKTVISCSAGKAVHIRQAIERAKQVAG